MRLESVEVVGLLAAGIAVTLVGAGLFSYLALPALISHNLAGKLRNRYSLEQRPDVDVTSGLLTLLSGRISHVRVRIGRMSHESIEIQNVSVNLENVRLLLSGIFRDEVKPDIRSVYLRAEISQESLSQYIKREDIGVRNGEVGIQGGEVFYRSQNALFGFPANVRLELRVAGAHRVAVSFGDLLVGGARLPSSLIGGALPSGGVTLDIGELPFGAALRSIEPLEGALMLRAGR